MILKEWNALFREELTSYSKEEADRLFFIFLEEFFGISRVQVLSNTLRDIDGSSQKLLLAALEKLKNGIPYQH